MLLDVGRWTLDVGCWTSDVGRVGLTVDAATVAMRRSVDIQVVCGGFFR